MNPTLSSASGANAQPSGPGNFNSSNPNSGRFPSQGHPTWDPSFGATFPWSVASTSAAAAASAIEAAAYFASAGQPFPGSGYPGGDFGNYPWTHQWPGVDSRWQMPKMPTNGTALPLGTLGAHGMNLALNPNRGSLGGRRRRNLFAPQQVIELQRAFTQNMYLKPEDRESLAKRTGLSVQQIKIWFQNNRYKCKQKEKDEARARKQARQKSNDSHGSSASSNSNSNENTPRSSTSGSSGTNTSTTKESLKTDEVESDEKETPPKFAETNTIANISAMSAESPPDLKMN
uniref:Homeobox domain-containing protein n=1 Tax=Acrobeloides nanus TaxID=290746 RepID=A0A914EN58_9BILA